MSRAAKIARMNSKAWRLNNKMCQATRKKHKRYASRAARAVLKNEH